MPIDEDEATWQAPLIVNPRYSGPWAPRQPAGPPPGTAPANRLPPVVAVGIEVWSLEGGVLFDNILLTHDAAVLAAFTQATWQAKNALERAALDTLLASSRTPEAERRAVGRQDYCPLSARRRQPEGLYEHGLHAARQAAAVALEDPRRFRAEYARPAFLGCLSALLCTALAGWLVDMLVQRRARRRAAQKSKAVQADELDDYSLPGSVQKSAQAAAKAVPAPAAEGAVARQRVFSSPLQRLQAASAPTSPRPLEFGRAGPATILEEPEDGLCR